jgi:hypothetical protein
MRKLAVVLAILFSATALHADQPDLKKAAREVLGKYQDAVVAVRLVVKTGRLEQQLEVAGTMLTPEGLTVISDFTSNPSGLFMGDGGRSETTDVKLLLKDGRELPARFVLRDRDLDLAFIMPREKDLKLAHVNLEKRTPPEILDDLIFLRRLGRNLNREANLILGRVESVVKKPRTFIVPDLVNGLQNLGCPVFDAEGKPVGIVLVRRAAAMGREAGGLMDLLDSMKPVILTAEDLQESLDQIAQAEKPAIKP